MGDSPEMSQELSKRLFIEGATLILLDVPIGTEFGVDLKAWCTGHKFKGVKMIPPGIHMVYYSATNKLGDVAPRISFMHNFKQSEVLVKKWDYRIEDFSSEGFSEQEISRFKADLLNFDKYLGVYPFECWKKWKKLSDKLTANLLERLMPECGVIRSALELVAATNPQGNTPKETNRKSTSSEEKEERLLPELKAVPGTELRLTPIPKHSFPLGASPSDITKHSLDSSYMLETMLSTLQNPCELIGELQFSFLCFLVGLSLEAFEHWTKLVCLICKSESAILRRRELYSQFLPTLEVQLSHVPEDFLVDIVASDNVIYKSLREMFRNMANGHNLEGRLRCEADRLRHRLAEKFSWDFDDLEREEDDEAPVIVELDIT